MADPHIIYTMARAIMESRDPKFGNGCGCIVVNWAEEARDNPHVAQAVAQARAALRALHKSGPTSDLESRFRDALHKISLAEADSTTSAAAKVQDMARIARAALQQEEPNHDA